MLDLIIAMLAYKGVLEEEEAKKVAKSLFGRPLPGDYDSMVKFVDRLFTEAKRSLERKYFDPNEFEKEAEKAPEKSKPTEKTETPVKKTVAKKK